MAGGGESRYTVACSTILSRSHGPSCRYMLPLAEETNASISCSLSFQ